MVDAHHNGYVLCELTPDTFTARYRVVEGTATETSPVSTLSSWVISAGTPGVSPLA
jgi:phosphodiesterase/alkaline phosphatase D-like protein